MDYPAWEVFDLRLQHLWPLWFLLLIPVIIIFWLLKQKAYEHPFSSILLWQEVWKNHDKATPWERLKHNLLMYLQILAVLVLVLAMTSPYIPGKQINSDRVILSIDVSGSMNALMDMSLEDGKTRFDMAIEQASDYVRSLSENSWITVVTMGENTQVELSATQDKAKVLSLLECLQCTQHACDLKENIQFLSALNASMEDAAVIVFSDTPMDLEDGFYQVLIESEGVNVSVDWVSHRIVNDGMEVMAWITNRSEVDFKGELDIYVEESLKDIVKINIGAGEAAAFSTILKGDFEKSSYVYGSIHDKDMLLQDNKAYEILDTAQLKRVLIVGDGNTFLENALMSIDNFQIYKADKLPADSSYDIYIFDGILPEEDWTPGNSAVIYINSPSTVENVIENVWLNMCDTKLSQYIHPWKFAVRTCTSYDVPDWGTSLIKTSSGKSVSYYGINDGHFEAVIGFDFFDTDFALQTNFPIFIHNLMHIASEENLTSVQSVQVGEAVTLYVNEDADVTMITPENETIELSADNNVVEMIQSGLYTFYANGEDGQRVSYVWSYFPSEHESPMEIETYVSASDELGNAAKIDHSLDDSMGYNLKNILIIVCILIIIAEGFVFLKQRPRHRRLTLVCHGLAVLFLILALANIQLRQVSREIETVFVVDVSDSMGSDKDDAIRFVKDAISEMPKDNYAGVVAFGENALVDQFITQSKVFDKVQARPVSSATNMENALLTAMAMLDSDKGKRIVLLTDGKQNQGDILNAQDFLLENEVMVDVVYYDEDDENEIYVDSLTIPEIIHVGDTFSIETNIISTTKNQAIIYLYNGRDLKLTREVSLNVGNNRFVFNDVQEDTGLSQYRIRVTADGSADGHTVNNEYFAYTTVDTSPKILVIEGDAGKASEFEKVLTAANINYDCVTAGGVPETMAQMLEYKSMITVDVYVDDLKESFLNCLDSYIKDYGGGFIATGGENSFALGGYRGTVLEDVLPVYMDLEGEKEIPTMSMVMVIDHSGSMSDGDGRTTNLDLAKAAAISALDNLRETDRLGVLGFSDSYSWYVPLETLNDGTKASDGIYSIPLSGGTSIYPALKEAIEALEEENTQIRHVLLLTDGQDGFRDYDDLLEQASSLGITVSTVSIGDGADVSMLEELAKGGNGRYYHATLNTDLPRIFAKEVFLSAKAYLVNRDFTPVITSNHSIVQTTIGDGLPIMRGYIGSKAKASSTRLLVSDEDDPILTMWQYGLGKTVAFNSDVMHYWTGYYAGWENWPLLWKNIVEETILKVDSKDSKITVNYDGGEPEIVYHTSEYSSETEVFVVYTTPEGNRMETIMKPKSPGEYVLSLNESIPGVYMLNVKQLQSKDTISSINSAVIIPYSAEYRYEQNNQDFIRFCDYSKARMISTVDELYEIKPEMVFAVRPLTFLFMIMGLGIFMFDIVWRRIGPQIKVTKNRSVEVKNKKLINNDKIIKNERKNMEKTHKSEYNKKDSRLDTNTLLKNKQNWKSGF